MLESSRFLVKEQTKFLSSHATYDIYDADTQQAIGKAEETISGLTKLLRWFVSKALMPTRIEIRETLDNSLVFTISRGWYIFQSRVEIHDAVGEFLGYFKSKVFSFGGGFYVYDKKDKQFAEVKGNFIGFNYKILTPDHDFEMGHVTKNGAGWRKKFSPRRILTSSKSTKTSTSSPSPKCWSWLPPSPWT